MKMKVKRRRKKLWRVQKAGEVLIECHQAGRSTIHYHNGLTDEVEYWQHIHAKRSVIGFKSHGTIMAATSNIEKIVIHEA